MSLLRRNPPQHRRRPRHRRGPRHLRPRSRSVLGGPGQAIAAVFVLLGVGIVLTALRLADGSAGGQPTAAGPVDPGADRAGGLTAGPQPAAPAAVTPRSVQPGGELEAVRVTETGFEVSGWASLGESDVDEPVRVHVWRRGGSVVPPVTADPRFDTEIHQPLPPGGHVVCAQALDPGGGPAVGLGCLEVFASDDPLPLGALDSLTWDARARTIHAVGWAADPDTPEPVTVRIRVVGEPDPLAEVRADLPRADLADARPGLGVDHGFDEQVEAELDDGLHTVCVQATNLGAGDRDPLVGCRLVGVGVDVPQVEPGAVVHLTFDDGPTPGSTGAVLDALAAHDARATFFAVGGSVAAQPELAGRIVSEGHSLQNHTWSHPSLPTLDDGAIASQLSRASAAIESAGGATPTCMRPPYGEVDDRVRAAAGTLGLQTTMWTVDTLDWTSPGADRIVHEVLSRVAPGAIVLLHDGGVERSQTVEAVPIVLDELVRMGYSFAPVC